MGAGEPDSSSLASSASQGVQAILEAAEASAAEIRREAEADADAIRARAHADVGRASESIESALGRLEQLHRELGALITSLRGEPGSPRPAVETPDLDAAGVRLIALNMALDGTPRERTAQFLAENFPLADVEPLLDEVYASVEG